MRINKELDPFERLSKMYQEVKVQCKCGRKEIIPYWVDKQLCSWCGHYIYRNKRIEFKEKLIKEIKKYESKRI